MTTRRHRPRRARKLTPKQRVLKKFPTAVAYRVYGRPFDGDMFTVYEGPIRSEKLYLGMGYTWKRAWANAARRLK